MEGCQVAEVFSFPVTFSGSLLFVACENLRGKEE